MIKTFAATLGCLLGLASLSLIHADTPLELSMQRMGKAYKQLSLDLKAPVDASKSDYLDLARKLKTEAQTARDLVPKKAASLPADQQATMVTAYQKSMDALSTTIDTLTQALQNSQWDDARKAMDSLKQQMFAGHKDFRGKGNMLASTPATPPPAAPAATSPAQPGTPPPAAPAQ